MSTVNAVITNILFSGYYARSAICQKVKYNKRDGADRKKRFQSLNSEQWFTDAMCVSKEVAQHK